MANIQRTAMGKSIDIDRLRLANESTIAVGNTKTNARGDLLGPGGQVVKTRAQLQQEYYQLNTPLADDETPVMASIAKPIQPDVPLLQPTADDTPVVESASLEYIKPRGSFAGAVAGETEVKQEMLTPLDRTGSTKPGVKRI